MNLARHAAVLWRFRGITAAGLLLGVFLAVIASYDVSPSGLSPRGASTYTSQSQLLVTQAGFPEGRVILPTAPVVGSETEQPKVDPDRLEFADPSRFMALADLYTKLLVSDEVLRRIPQRPTPAQITASPLPAVSGAPVLPIIQLDTIAESPAAARQLNVNAAEALRGLLAERQKKNDISPAQSIQISTLAAPSAGVLATAPSKTASILALLLCLVATVAVTHLLENFRPRRDPGDVDELEDWTAGDPEDETVPDRELVTAFAPTDWGRPAPAAKRAAE